MKAFNPRSFLGTMGRDSMHQSVFREHNKDEYIVTKFYKAFPQLKVMPHIYSFYQKKGSDKFYDGNPIFDFVQKFKTLRRKGYSEYKAFSVVEAELRALLETQLDETRILRGAAMAAHGDSYLDRA